MKKGAPWLIPVATLRPGINRLDFDLDIEELGGTEREVAENPSFEKLVGKVHAALTITRTGRQLLVAGGVRFRARLECAVCGVEFEREFDEQLPAQLVSLEGGAGPEAGGFSCGEPERAVLRGDLLDLRSTVRDAIHLAIPIAPRCREECLGVCPECGADLNRETCRCSGRRASRED